MDNATALPAEGSTWALDDAWVTVVAVKKKGRGYYVQWSVEAGGGRTRLKEWERKAKAA